MKKSAFLRGTLITLALLAIGAPSYAEQSAGADGIWTRDKLTGDWAGLRTDLSNHGINIGLRLSQYAQSVAAGGVDENGEYGATMDNLRNPWGFEVYYNYEINNWLRLTGDLQLVKNERDGSGFLAPGGRSSDDLAIIPGARLVMDF